MIALSGMLAVLKDRIATYCRLAASSPSKKLLGPGFLISPALLPGADSRIKLSCWHEEMKVTSTGSEVEVLDGTVGSWTEYLDSYTPISKPAS
jgi:hypothetical protein